MDVRAGVHGILPWAVTAPLLAAAILFGVFFKGTDSVLYAPAFFCLLLLAAIELWPSLRGGIWRLPVSATAGLVLAFGLYVSAALFWSTTPYISTIFTLILAVLPFLAAVIVLSPDPGKSAAVYAGTAFAVIAGIALWALVQFFFLYGDYGPRIRHPLINPNDLAALILLALLPALAVFFAAPPGRAAAGAFAVFCLLYLALIVTQSRGGLLSFCIAAAVLAAANLRSMGRGLLKTGAAVAAVAVLPFAVNGLSGGALEKNLSALPRVMETGSATDRLMLWSATLRMVRDHVWLGTGLGTFYFNYPAYRDIKDRSDGFFAHMDPLQFWAEMGIAAPALFYAVLAAVLLRTVSAVRFAGNDRILRLAVTGSFCALLAPVLSTHISFHLYMPGILIPLSALLAFWYVATERASGLCRKTVQAGGWKKSGLLFAFCALTLLTGGWMARWAASASYLKRVQAATATGATAGDVAGLMDRARFFAPPGYSKYHEYEARLIVAALFRGAKTMDPDEARRQYEKAEKALDRAQALNPAYTGIRELRAKLYFAVDGVVLADGLARAQAVLEQVVVLNPLSSDSRIGLANIYAAQGDVKKARALLEKGLKWPRPRGESDVALLLAAAQMRGADGDAEGRKKLIGEALRRAKAYGLTVKENAP